MSGLHNEKLVKIITKIVLSDNLPADRKKVIDIDNLFVADQLQKNELIDKIDSVDASQGFMFFNTEEYAMLMLKKFMPTPERKKKDAIGELNSWYTEFIKRMNEDGHLVDPEGNCGLIRFNELLDAYKLKFGSNTEPGGEQ